MPKPELLAPAGSPEAVVAAVRAGADAVYLAYGDFNARRRAKNFTEEDFKESLAFCHARGVKVYLTLNTLLTDRELPRAVETAREASFFGVDAIIIQDMGLICALQAVLPDMPLHASTQMTIHNVDGVRVCERLGMERVVLSRELSRNDLATLAQDSPLELEVFAHGALCMCYSGQCFFSALVGERSGNRGLCAQPCRLAYRQGKDKTATHPLSLKDLSLAGQLEDLEAMGIACLKIEGRMKRPEYVALVTDIYSRLLREGRRPTAEEDNRLRLAFSREGFTQGYFTGEVDGQMFGRRSEGEGMPEALLHRARAIYQSPEAPFLGLDMRLEAVAGVPLRLEVKDAQGRVLRLEGDIVQTAQNRPTTADDVASQLGKLGGTVYFLCSVDIHLGDGVYIPKASLNALRREMLAQHGALCTASPLRQSLPFALPLRIPNRKNRRPSFHISCRSCGQLPRDLDKNQVSMLSLPLEHCVREADRVQGLQTKWGIPFAVILPRIVHDDEMQQVRAQLEQLKALGIVDVWVGNWGLFPLCAELGFRIHGDFGLGLCNSLALQGTKALGAVAGLVSFELNFAQIRDMSKCFPTELYAYGRVPMMLMEHCLLPKGKGCNTCSADCQGQSMLQDRKGERFPLLRSFGGRTELFNAKTIFLADKMKDILPLGLASLRLDFSTENAQTVEKVLDAYLGKDEYIPQNFTRGLYYRKVE